MARDAKKLSAEIRAAALEHKRKMETDPEYRKKAEETKKRFEEHLYGFKKYPK